MNAPSSSAGESTAFIANLMVRIQAARVTAARTINRELVALYWDIGAGIAEKQRTLGWGEAVVERVATDLRRAFPGVAGFSPRSLRDMKRLYLTYSDGANWRQAVANLSLDERGAPNRSRTAPRIEDEISSSPGWRQPVDRPSIGIILFAEKDNLEVEYALRTRGNPIGVAAYQLQPTLPAAFKGKLPTPRQLSGAVRALLPPKPARPIHG